MGRIEPTGTTSTAHRSKIGIPNVRDVRFQHDTGEADHDQKEGAETVTTNPAPRPKGILLPRVRRSLHGSLVQSALLFAIWAATGTPASATVTEETVTKAEWALLPPYCRHTMGFKGHTYPHVGRWEAVMGPGFFHMHHYCWALINLGRAERTTLSPQKKHGLRKEALGDLWYAARNAGEDFILLPEIMTWIGRTEVMLAQPDKALEAFAKVRSVKPDYWPAYFHWASLLEAHGRRNEALAIAKEGLQQTPKAESLRLLFRSLGGNPDLIVPAPIQNTDSAPSEPVTQARQGDGAASGSKTTAE